jgi:peptide/nickel transport system permease protein
MKRTLANSPEGIQRLTAQANRFAQITKRRFGFAYLVFRLNPASLLGLIIVLTLVLAAVFGPLALPYSPNKTNAPSRFQPPSSSHLFGTDKYGRDVFTRVLSAAQVDLLIALGSIGLAFIIGTAIGALSAFFKGAVDAVLMRIMDMIKSFPQFILAMALVAALGPGVRNLIIVITVIMVPSFARMIRSRILTLREMPYVDAARTGGVPWWKIILVYLVPNSLGTMVVTAALNVSYAMLDAAGLSYLGLGVRPPQAEWGMMISEGTSQLLSGRWWISVFPGLALFVSVLGFNLLADGLRDIFDPRMRR